MPENTNDEILYGELINRCWEDPLFRARMMNEPKAVLREAGIETPDGIEIRAVFEPVHVKYIVLPADGGPRIFEETAKRLAAMAAGESEDIFIPEGMELRVLQNTKTLQYVVVPEKPPETMALEELDRVAAGVAADPKRGRKPVKAWLYATNVIATDAVVVNMQQGLSAAVVAAVVVAVVI